MVVLEGVEKAVDEEWAQEMDLIIVTLLGIVEVADLFHITVSLSMRPNVEVAYLRTGDLLNMNN
jgi:hypothetical protein